MEAFKNALQKVDINSANEVQPRRFQIFIPT